jgi:hypothetical protein
MTDSASSLVVDCKERPFTPLSFLGERSREIFVDRDCVFYDNNVNIRQYRMRYVQCDRGHTDPLSELELGNK